MLLSEQCRAVSEASIQAVAYIPSALDANDVSNAGKSAAKGAKDALDKSE